MKRTYSIQFHDPRGEWVRVAGLEQLPKGYAEGYFEHHRAAPGPKLGARLVRSDGKVIDEIPAIDEVSIGAVAGWPTWQQYAAAARAALQRAEGLVRDESRTIGRLAALEPGLEEEIVRLNTIALALGNAADFVKNRLDEDVEARRKS